MLGHDSNIAWVRKRLYIPHAKRAMGGALDSITQFGSIAAAGLKITTTGVAYQYAIPVPKDLNPQFPLGYKVFYGGSGTTLTSLTFTILSDIRAINSAIATPTTALDTVIGAQTLASGYNGKLLVSSRGIRNANWTTSAVIFTSGAILTASLNCSAAGGTMDTNNAAWLIGLELDYVPMKTRFPHSEIDSPLDDAAI